MFWGTLKRAVAAKNLNFKFSEVVSITEEENLKIGPQAFKRYDDHIKGVDKKILKMDRNWMIFSKSMQLETLITM